MFLLRYATIMAVTALAFNMFASRFPTHAESAKAGVEQLYNAPAETIEKAGFTNSEGVKFVADLVKTQGEKLIKTTMATTSKVAQAATPSKDSGFYLEPLKVASGRVDVALYYPDAN